jgi:hypothetical protein
MINLSRECYHCCAPKRVRAKHYQASIVIRPVILYTLTNKRGKSSSTCYVFLDNRHLSFLCQPPRLGLFVQCTTCTSIFFPHEPSIFSSLKYHSVRSLVSQTLSHPTHVFRNNYPSGGRQISQRTFLSSFLGSFLFFKLR